MSSQNHPARRMWHKLIIHYFDLQRDGKPEEAKEIADLISSIEGIFPDEISEERETYG